MKRALLRGVLTALPVLIGQAARRHERVRKHLQRENCVIQLRLRDRSISRHLTFRDGKVRAGWGTHESPDAEMVFVSLATALAMLKPDPDQAVVIDALKNFKATAGGSDRHLVWFGELMHRIETSSWKYGRKLRDGTTRYTNLTNGGPIHVDVKDGRIVRTMPIEFGPDDPASWSTQARGRTFTPLRTATVSPHALSMKSLVYSPRRLLYPMKRVGFDSNGDRRTEQRGRAQYERIEWDEALEIVTGEIRRMKQQYGPGAIAIAQPAHHQWGNINYWLSALYRFGNLIGHT
jgi:Molybdopterin oxidoreductase